MSLITDALLFATEAHAGQVRKYTGQPYIEHPMAVYGYVATRLPNHEVAQAVALLHDVAEDTDVTIDAIDYHFGYQVAEGVSWMTEFHNTGMNRYNRKQLQRNRLYRAPDWVQTVKLADLLSNTPSIIEYDPNFAKVYMLEAQMLLHVLLKGDSILRHRMQQAINDYRG